MGCRGGVALLLLYTHALIWLDGGRPELGRTSRSLCDQARAAGMLTVSAVTFWEIALLARRGRIVARLPLERWRRDLIGTGLSEIGLDGRMGIRAAELEGLHRDPADRLIVATALQTGARLLTADRRILDWPGDLDCQDART